MERLKNIQLFKNNIMSKMISSLFQEASSQKIKLCLPVLQMYYVLVLSRLLGWPYINTYIHISHNKDLLWITQESSISESFFLNDLTEADQMPAWMGSFSYPDMYLIRDTVENSCPTTSWDVLGIDFKKLSEETITNFCVWTGGNIPENSLWMIPHQIRHHVT